MRDRGEHSKRSHRYVSKCGAATLPKTMVLLRVHRRTNQGVNAVEENEKEI